MTKRSSNPEHSLDKSFIQQLRSHLGASFVLDKPEELMVYECDGCTLIQQKPQVVALPASPEEVATLIQLCNQFHVPYTARGAGTGLSGGALPMQAGVLISLNRMKRIVGIDIHNRTATVETGVVNATLNQALASHGLFYAPDPSSQSACTIGGNIAENAGGIHCMKYGVTTDHVLALQVVLPNGELVWLGQPTNRRTHGLNLAGLVVGSEGTLGIVTQAVLRLLPKPETVRVYLAAFSTISEATASVSEIIRNGLLPSALEFMDAFTIRAVNEAFGVGFPEDAEAVLLIELDGPNQRVNLEEVQLKAILTSNGVTQLRIGETETERLALWKARKATVAAYGRYFPAFYLHDCVIPRSQLTPILEIIQEVEKRYDLTIGNVFHAGDGNLHPNILFDPANSNMVQNALRGGEEILKACLAMGGTLSGEHGIGIEKSEYMPLQFSVASLDKMRQVKHVFDPTGLSNPDKIFPRRTGCGETHQAVSSAQLTGNQSGLWI